MKSIFGANHPTTPSQKALDVPGIKTAHFWKSRQVGDLFYGVIYDEQTGQEYDVREVRFGWNVNDDWGHTHFGLTLRHAILKARAANG